MSSSIGQPIVRYDGRAKVTGAARYAADWREPRTAHAVIFQSSIPCGSVLGFDERAARAVPGVIEILTRENAPRLHGKAPKVPPSLGDPHLPLQDREVYYHGQPLGVVIAETIEAAEQAARLVSISYRPDEGILGFAARQREAKTVKHDANGRKATDGKGDLDLQIAAADHVLRRTYALPLENHHPIETSSTLAVWKDQRLTVYDATQGVAGAAKVLAGVFKLDEEDVHLISKFIGGGFGCKGSVWSHVIIAALAAQATGRPVRLAISRLQMATNVGYRAPTIQQVTLASDRRGRLLGIGHETVNPTAMDKDYAETTGALFKLLYDAPAIRTTQKLINLHYPCPTFMRAPGESSGSFALESAMDELAHELRIDPIEIRLINHADRDPLKDIPFSSKSLKQCYAEGARRFGWTRRRQEPGAVRDGEHHVGYGMATASYPVHVFPAKARVTLLADGSAKVVSATQDIGTGTYTVMRQIAADVLGIPYERVEFDLGDSLFPAAGVSGGSSTVSSVGWAIDAAGRDALDQLRKLARKDASSPCHGLDLDRIAAGAGRVYDAAAPERGEGYGDLMRRNGLQAVDGEGALDLKKQKAGEKKFSQHAYGAHFAEVRVHALTGEVQLVRMVGAFAAGRIVNPRTARSQFMGGMIFGIGMALTESNVVDERDGRFMARDLAEYHVPVNLDVPELDIVTIAETDAVVNPAGTKGIGEIGTVGSAAAIANAVFNATGIRVRELPITPDKLVVDLHRA